LQGWHFKLHTVSVVHLRDAYVGALAKCLRCCTMPTDLQARYPSGWSHQQSKSHRCCPARYLFAEDWKFAVTNRRVRLGRGALVLCIYRVCRIWLVCEVYAISWARRFASRVQIGRRFDIQKRSNAVQETQQQVQATVLHRTASQRRLEQAIWCKLSNTDPGLRAAIRTAWMWDCAPAAVRCS